MTVTIYHNPRCSKSRQTLALLEEQGLAPRIVEYLKTPPTAAELKAILKKLGLKPRDLIREGEPRYAELGLKDRDVDDDTLIDADGRQSDPDRAAHRGAWQQGRARPPAGEGARDSLIGLRSSRRHGSAKFRAQVARSAVAQNSALE